MWKTFKILTPLAALGALAACQTDPSIPANCITKEPVRGTVIQVAPTYVVATAEDGSQFNVPTERLERPAAVGDILTLMREVVAPDCQGTY